MSENGRRLCERLLAESLEPTDALRLRVERHREKIDAAARSSKLFDAPLARRIADVLLNVLDTLHPEQHRAAQLAVRYFEKDADGDPDFESVLGFEDDAVVVNVILRFIGRDDLLIDIP